MILNLSKKLTSDNNIKHLTNDDIKNLLNVLYNDAFDFSNQYYSSEDKKQFAKSLFLHDSLDLDEFSFNQKVIEILKKLDSSFKEVIIETSEPLDQKQKTKIKSQLQNDHNNIYPIFKVNKDLIGGMKVYIDGTLIDKSFENLFNKIKDTSQSKNLGSVSDLKYFLNHS